MEKIFKKFYTSVLWNQTIGDKNNEQVLEMMHEDPVRTVEIDWRWKLLRLEEKLAPPTSYSSKM